jgi:aryl sulfotransferase
MKKNIHILQAGVPKSGNYWLYKIIENILATGGVKKKSFITKHPSFPKVKKMKLNHKDRAYMDVISIKKDNIFYSIGPTHSEKIVNFDKYINKTTHVWTHSPFTKQSKLFFPKFDKIVYILRDPRDVALSMSDYAFTPYVKKYFNNKHDSIQAYLDINFENSLLRWSENVTSYLTKLNSYNIYVIFYERLVDDTEKEINNLAEFLGTKLTKKDLNKIVDAVTFKNMKKESPGHLNKGKSYRWKTALNLFQKKRAYFLIKEILAYLHYPLYDTQNSQPRLPKRINSKLLIEYSKLSKKRRKLPLFRLIHLISIIFAKESINTKLKLLNFAT